MSHNHIFEEVRRLAASGVTVVYTSHYIEEVESLCSRIGIIDHGKLVACDQLESLLQQLHGLIRLRVDDGTERLRNTLSAIPGASLNGQDGPWLEVECRDTKTMLARVITALNELDVKLVSLEVTEPNLERVFLHLTGRALRD